MVFNGVGAVLSAIVFVIAGVTKFAAGVWVSILVVVAVAIGGSRMPPLRDRPPGAGSPPLADEVPRLTAAPHGRQRLAGAPANRARHGHRAKPRGDPPAGDRPGKDHRPGRHARIGLRRIARAARARRPRKPDARGGRPLPRLLEGLGPITCRSNSSSPPTARSSPRSCTTSRRLTDSAPTSH
jgi:hypothetical protein